MNEALRPRVAWITHVPAPYRLPIFEELCLNYDLEVIYLTSHSTYREWTTPDFVGYKVSEFPSVKIPGGSFRLFFPKRSARKLIEGFEVIVVGGWDTPVFLYALWVAQRLGKLPVLFYESTLGSRRFRRGPVSWVRNWAFARANRIIVPGQEAKESVMSSVNLSASPVIAFNPIDVDYFDRSTVIDKSPGEGHKYLYVGRFIDLKNVDQLIRAFAKVAREDDTLTIAGYGPNEKDLRSLSAEIAGGRVIFVGRKDFKDLPKLYAEHHTQVLPSKEREVWGMVVVEALCMGLSSVVSSECGILASIKDVPGVYGFDPSNQRSLEEALVAAREEWKGPLDSSQIRSLASPKNFVQTLRDAKVLP